MLAALKAAAAAAAQEKEQQKDQQVGGAPSQEQPAQHDQQSTKSGKTRFPPIGKPTRSATGAAAASADTLGSMNAPKSKSGAKEARASSPATTVASEETAASSNSGGAKGIMALRRLSKKMSMWGRMSVKKPAKPEAPKKRLENTYRTPEQLTPRAKFNPTKVETMLNNVLTRELGESAYDGRRAKATATKLADLMKTKIKMMGFKRHKVVVHVIIGPLVGQGLRIGSRCVWDERTDGYASANYQNSHLFAVATAYCALYE